MFKSTKKLIVLGFSVLATLVFMVSIAPKSVAGQHQTNDDGYAYLDYMANPIPFITSLNQTENTDVLIKGYGFMSTSVARFNGVNYPTTFIDSSHLLIQLNQNDIQKDLLYVSVFNEGPGGGYSNALSLKPTTALNTSNENAHTNNNSSINDNRSNSGTNISESEDKNVGSLAANAVFGVNTILPSGLIQWVLLAIIVILLVLVVRRLMGLTDAYHATPLKHD